MAKPPTDAPAPDAEPALEDSVLMQAEREIEAQLLPDNRADYLKIVVAGMRAGMHGGDKSIVAGLKNKSKDPIHDAAVGAVNLVMLLKHMSPAMPLKAAVPAAFTLMLHALDIVDKAGIAKVGTPELIRATHVFTNQIMGVLHLTPQQLQHAAGVVQQIAADPVKMDAIGRKAGVLKHPMASEMTPLPQGPKPGGLINQE